LSSQFISFEGIDGSGKSTQMQLFAENLKKSGDEPILSREPGGSTGAEEIRKLLVEGDPDRWSAYTEILLFTAARRDHLERTILPNLDAGKIVITDRFADSTRVYQGVARNDLAQMVNALHDLMIAHDPNLTFIIDIDPKIALDRGLARQSGEDRFEDFGLEFQKSLRLGFIELSQKYSERCVLINGDGTTDQVAKRVWQAYEAHHL
jgi:dTMP kinase